MSFITLLFIPSIVWAARTVVVDTKILNVRTGPDTTFDKVGQVEEGQRLPVIGEDKGWYQVALVDGNTGWLIGDYVKVGQETQNTSRQKENTSREVEITGNTVNVRSGPGTIYDKVASVEKGTKVTVLSTKTDWYQIKLASGVTGWIATWLAEPIQAGQTSTEIKPVNVKQALVTASSLNVRSGPDINATKLTTVPYGTRLNVIAQSGDWYQVTLGNGQKGWVASWLVQLSNTAISAWAYQVAEAPVFQKAGSKPNETGAQIINWQWEKIPSGIRITIQGTKTIDYVVNKKNTPPQIVVELEGKLEGDSETRVKDINYGSVNSVQTSTKSNDSIINIVLNENVPYQTRLNQNGNVLSIDIAYSAVFGKTIVIDPGHGSMKSWGDTDPGAIGPKGLRERDVVLDMGEQLRAILSERGAKVVMTRTGSTNLSLEGRAQVANEISADVFVSIHANSSPSRSMSGTSTYFYAPVGTDLGIQRNVRRNLAKYVQDKMLEQMNRSDLGVREGNLAVLRNTKVPSILVETAFISNYEEEALLGDANFRRLTANAIAEGLADYFISMNQ